MLEGITKQDLNFQSQLTLGGQIYADSKATVLCADCHVKLSSLRVDGSVRVLPKYIHLVDLLSF